MAELQEIMVYYVTMKKHFIQNSKPSYNNSQIEIGTIIVIANKKKKKNYKAHTHTQEKKSY